MEQAPKDNGNGGAKIVCVLLCHLFPLVAKHQEMKRRKSRSLDCHVAVSVFYNRMD